MTDDERREVLDCRRHRRYPWHSPPHCGPKGCHEYIITAACYEHAGIIGRTPERIDAFVDQLLPLVGELSDRLFAWCVLPNHYHLVVQTALARELLTALGRLHGRTSHEWNGEDNTRGRKVWHGAADRRMRSEAHLWASINYTHNNPVRHGYVKHWQDWPWSSARGFIDEVGRERAVEIWRAYPVGDYGKDWDL